MPDEYEGKFASNEWNATNITSFHTGPDGYHWALLNIGSCKPSYLYESLPSDI